MRKLLIATALLAASATASAEVVEVFLLEHLIGRAGNVPSASLINPAPTFAGDSGGVAVPTYLYDDVTGELSSSGVTHVRSQTNPSEFGRIFDRFITDLNIVGGSAAGTTAYECVDGGFQFAVGASFCGNYTWGANGANDSTISYGPGLAFSRTMGGDDVISGDPQTIDDYNLVVASYTGIGGELVLQSTDWNPTSSAGTQMRFSVVPVPAAVWLFGSGLGLLALVRRRFTS